MKKAEKQQWRESQAAFYVSVAWIDCARVYRMEHPLCERCLARHEINVAEEVHHKIKLTPGNINKPDVVLNWDNLEALCKKCHQEEHNREREQRKRTGRRWSLDESGGVVLRDSPLGA